MAAAAFQYLKLTDTLACQGGQSVFGVLHPDELKTSGDTLSIENAESLVFSFTRIGRDGVVRPIVAQLKHGRVMSVVWTDGSFDEWRVSIVQQGRGESGLVTVTCSAIWLDLVERPDGSGPCGWVSDMTGVRVRNFEYVLTSRTASSIFSNFVIPNGPSYFALGNVDPTAVIPSLTVSRLTPGALALATRDYLRSVDVPCELRARRNGTTNYLLDLVTQVGAAAAVPAFHPSISLSTLQNKADATTQATRAKVAGATDPSGTAGVLGRARWICSAPSGNTIVLSDRNGGGAPVQFDGQWVNLYLLRVKTGRTFPITASSAAAGSVTLGSISTIAAGEDFEFRLTEPGTNTRSTVTRYAVSSVPDGTHVTCAASNPVIADGQYIDWYARAWSASSGGSIIATTRITGSVASTDVVAVASSSGITSSHFLEFIQLDGDGEIPCYVDHPLAAADPAGYGLKVVEITRATPLGVTNWCPNSWTRAWAGALPDGWSNPGGGGVLTKNTNAAFVRYGPTSLEFAPSGGGPIMQIWSPPIYPNVCSIPGYFSVRVWLYMTVFGGSSPCHVSVYALNADGTLPGSPLWSTEISDAVPTTGVAQVVVNEWVSVEGVGIPISAAADCPYGCVVVLAGIVATQNLFGYIGAIEVYGFQTNPSTVNEFGDATVLLQAGNSQLKATASPPLFATFGVKDLARGFPLDFPRLALTLGGNVRGADVEYGNDLTVRLLEMQRDFLNPESTTLTLANLPALQSAQLAAAALAPAPIASVPLVPSATDPGAFVAAASGTTVALAAGANIIAPHGVLVAASTSSAYTLSSATPGTAPNTKVTIPGAFLTSP